MTIDNAATRCPIPVRSCPFCGDDPVLIHANDRYGIQCRCGVSFPPVYVSEVLTLIHWNRRSGGVAAAGGRSTKGISSARKRRASRRNLALARKAKRLYRLKEQIEASIALLRPIREKQITQAEAAAAENRARLSDRVAQIMADPPLRQAYALLRPIHAHVEPGSSVNGG